jgi:ATP-binding cassette subfamily C protein
VGVVATLFAIFTPQITGIIIDYAIPDANRKLLIQMGLGLLAASFGVVIFQLAQAFAILRLQTKVSYDTQAVVLDRLLKLKPTFFRQYSTGDLYNRVSAITQIRNRLSVATLRILFTSVFSLLNLGLLLFYSSTLVLVPLAITLLIFLVTTITSLITRQKFCPLQQLTGEILGLTVQLIGGVSKLRVAAAESEAFACWAEKYTQQVKLMLSTQFVEDVLTVLNMIMLTVSSTLVFTVVVSLIGDSQAETQLSTGIFFAFNTAFATFITSATRLSNTVIEILDITILWERAQPILKTTLEVDVEKFHPGKLSRELKLHQVSFRYRPDTPLILDKINNLKAKAGEFIAIVGLSGSGKSTILRLLLGFEILEMGAISYDGRDLSRLDVAAVRRQLGVVLQNGRIMSASIWENIAGGAIVTQDEAWLAFTDGWISR